MSANPEPTSDSAARTPEPTLVGTLRWRRGLLLALLLLTAAALWFSSASRAVIITVQQQPGADPLPADLAVDIDIQGLALRLGGNTLLLPGSYPLTVSAPGYQMAEQLITVDQRATQQQLVTLVELPGLVTLQLRTNGDQPLSTGDIASLLVDGQPAPLTEPLQLPRGLHQLTVVLPRYRPASVAVDVVGRGAEQPLALELTPAWAVRTLTSSPSGASVTVDGITVGTTPVAVELLEDGSEVSLELAGYEPWREQLAAQAGSDREVQVTLEPEKVSLAVRSEPSGAAVTLGEQYLGSTPLSVRVSAQPSAALTVQLNGYHAYRQPLAVVTGHPIELAVELTPALGTVAVAVNVSGSRVRINDEPAETITGRSVRLALPALPHQLLVEKPGYQAWRADIEPIVDRTQQLNVTLLTHSEAFWATRPSQINSPVGGQLRLIQPSGGIAMGSARREPGRRANEGQYRARLTRPFYLATTELTNRQYRQWREHEAGTVGGAPLGLDDQPVANVSWLEAAQFCNWLSDQAGLPRFYQISGEQLFGVDWNATGYRLPTETEWAYAARTGSDSQRLTYSWANQLYPPTAAVANYADQSAATLLPFTLSNYRDGFMVSAPVASFTANPYGLFDMDGNVSEWVNDYYSARPTAGEGTEDSSGPLNAELFVRRGASWALAGRSELRLAYRQSGSAAAMDVGFRVARFVDRRGVGPDTEPGDE